MLPGSGGDGFSSALPLETGIIARTKIRSGFRIELAYLDIYDKIYPVWAD
jgi:hypothetical protein